jgi:hypothetical protein
MYGPANEEKIQVVQHHSVVVSVANCSIVSTSRAYRCCFDSIAYGAKTAEFNKKTYPTAEECQFMLQNKRCDVCGEAIRLNANATRVTEGVIYANGKCENANFERERVLYYGWTESTEVGCAVTNRELYLIYLQWIMIVGV